VDGGPEKIFFGGVQSNLARVGLRVAVLVGLLLTFTPARARADDWRVEWNPDWPKFRWSEAAVTLGAGLAAGAAAFLYPPPPARWDGPLPFDTAARNLLRLHEVEARRSVAHVSDNIYYALVAYPIVVDVAIVALAVHRKPEVALQLFLIDLESQAVTGAIALTAEKLGRVRPMGQECKKDPSYDYKCTDERLNLSFLSGHTLTAFASAGLICVHHQHLPLYGGGVAEPIACAVGLAAATTAATMRVMSDNHYLSDVVGGAAIGFVGGYVLPSLLHYGFGSSDRPKKSYLPTFELGQPGGAVAGALAPSFAQNYVGLSLLGVTD
jgi:membrane-associated phospholipid phosphatase